MSENKDMGGRIYPSVGEFPQHPSKIERLGITRRDWLAGLAMQGELASQSPSSEWHKPNKLVKRVYMFADAMIAESNK